MFFGFEQCCVAVSPVEMSLDERKLFKSILAQFSSFFTILSSPKTGFFLSSSSTKVKSFLVEFKLSNSNSSIYSWIIDKKI